MLSFAVAALTFGVVAGIKPGALGVFIIHQTLSRGPRAGFMASLAPFITDGPIIFAVYLLSFGAAQVDIVHAVISLLGGGYLLWLAFKLMRIPASLNPSDGSGAASMFSAIKINALNPSPYLFWMTIGGSYILAGTILQAWVFIFTALVSLCLTKFLVALVVRRVGKAFNEKAFSLLIKSLAFPLLLFAGQLLYAAAQYLYGIAFV